MRRLKTQLQKASEEQTCQSDMPYFYKMLDDIKT